MNSKRIVSLSVEGSTLGFNTEAKKVVFNNRVRIQSELLANQDLVTFDTFQCDSESGQGGQLIPDWSQCNVPNPFFSNYLHSHLKDTVLLNMVLWLPLLQPPGLYDNNQTVDLDQPHKSALADTVDLGIAPLLTGREKLTVDLTSSYSTIDSDPTKTQADLNKIIDDDPSRKTVVSDTVDLGPGLPPSSQINLTVEVSTSQPTVDSDSVDFGPLAPAADVNKTVELDKLKQTVADAADLAPANPGSQPPSPDSGGDASCGGVARTGVPSAPLGTTRSSRLSMSAGGRG